jgi:hypothetical protein
VYKIAVESIASNTDKFQRQKYFRYLIKFPNKLIDTLSVFEILNLARRDNLSVPYIIFQKGQVMAINGSDAFLLKTSGGTIVKNQTVNDLANYLTQTASLGQICGGRLSLLLDTPITTADISGSSADKIYLNAYQSNWILLYDTSLSTWIRRSFSAPYIAPPSAISQAFDIFAYWTGSAVALETVNWNSTNTARVTNIERLNGIWVKVGNNTRLYLGSGCTVASAQTENSGAKRFLWNFYNPVAASFNKQLTGTAAAYDTISPPRQIAGNSANQVEAIVGLAGGHGITRVSVSLLLVRGVANGNVALASVAMDSKTTLSKISSCDTGLASGFSYCSGFWEGYVPFGVHYFSGNQAGAGTVPPSNTPTYCTWYMDGADKGFSGSILC